MKIAALLLVCFVSFSYQFDDVPVVEGEAIPLQNDGGLVQIDSSKQRDPRFLFWPFNIIITSSSSLLTSTVYVTTSSTLTSIIVQRCIASSYFSATASTSVTCRRKRSSFPPALELIEPIYPTQVQPVEATVHPESGRMLEPEIRSSNEQPNARNIQFFVATTTSTVTSFTVTTTTIKTSAIPATVSVLQCMPFGYVVC